MRSTSIRTQLLLLVLAMSVPLCALVAAGIYLDMQATIAHTKSSLRTLAYTMIRNTGATVASAHNSLHRLAARPLVKLVDGEHCDPALQDFLTMNPAYANVAYARLDGEVACSAVPLPNGRGRNIAATPWFQAFLREPRALVGLPHRGLITGKWVSVIGAPIRNDQQEVVGAIYLPLDLSVLDPHIPDAGLPPDSRYGFFAADGTMIWRNLDPEGVIGSKPNAEAARRIVAVRDGEFESLAIDGVVRYFSVVPMPDTGWIAFVGVPASAVYLAAKQRAMLSMLAALTVMGLLAVLAAWLAHRIIRPITQLEQAARRVHDGDFGARAASAGPGEIARVAQAFNGMADHIQASTRQLEAEVAERREMEEQVRQMAFRDALTQLPNRRLLHDRLSQAMAASKRSACYGAVMYLDLDHFKPLNDRYGHAVGDLLLVDAARRLLACVREVDTVARIGGDEFVVMVGELGEEATASAAQAEAIAQKIRHALAEPFRLREQREEGGVPSMLEHVGSVSIGVVMFRDHETQQDELIKQADAAMYQAKAAGGNRVCFFGA